MTGVVMAVIGLLVLVAIAAWQFYLFAVSKDAEGLVDVQGGTLHLRLAIGIALLVCMGGFFLFSRLVSYDQLNEIHITSQGHPLGAGRTNKGAL
jgi:hypothetical protein